MSINKVKYQTITNFIIDNMEGGYYHPDMLKDGRVKDSRYASSGETMFGIDRKAGGNLNTSDAGDRFWDIIDNAGARKNWKWNYKGGSLQNELKYAAADVMYNQYDILANKYLTPESKKIIESDDRLLFNFIYATWNGSGWFRKFATDFNKAVSEGIVNRDKLVDVAIKSRINSDSSLVRQGGNKIASLIDKLKTSTKQVITKGYEYAKDNTMPILLIAVGLITLSISGYLYIKNKK